MDKFNNYDETVSSSKEESLQLAKKILEQNLNKSERSELENNKRELKRPEINTIKKVLRMVIILVCLALTIITSVIIYSCSKHTEIFFVMATVILIIIALTAKQTIIDAILMYQKYAPIELRNSCLFEPSCSEYMILSIKKYGLIKGIFKGIKRLLRCHSPNGGIDYP